MNDQEQTGNPMVLEFDLEKAAAELHVRPEILKKLVTSFASTYAAKVAELEEDLKAKDITKMRAILHEVKGTAGNLRLDIIYKTADDMHVEVKGEANDEKLAASMAQLKQLALALKKLVE